MTLHIVPAVPSVLLSLLCKSRGQCGIYLKPEMGGGEDLNEVPYSRGILSAAPWVTPNLLIQLGLCDAAYVLFETEEEMRQAYDQTVGPNGLSTNPYRGPFRIYAVACDAQGELLGENC